MSVQIVIVGASGRMGSFATECLMEDPSFEIVGLIDLVEAEHPIARIPVETDLGTCLERTKPEVTLIFSTPWAAGELARTSVACGVPTVVGTTGISPSDIDSLRESAESVPCLLVPNFSIGAVLMMTFAKIAAKSFPNVEIIEYHNEKERNTPSGTALYTARNIAAARVGDRIPLSDQTERGIDVDGVTIHCVRLPGLGAHQEVLFGNQGEQLTIRHDSSDLTSFSQGIKLACTKVGQLKGFAIGLENLL